MKQRQLFNSAFIVFFLLVVLLSQSCSPRYTERQARRLFGCDTTSKTDSGAPVLARVDTIIDHDTIHGDTVYTESPCKEINNMKPGEKKTKRTGKASHTYGKTIEGKDFFQSSCDTEIRKKETYRQWWLQTVQTTNIVKDAAKDPSWWEKFQDKFQSVMAFWGIVATVILILKFWKST